MKVTTLPRNDSPPFSRREFAGYLKMRIPHPLDAKVLVAVKDPKLRAAMVPEDISILSVFGHRKAVEAIRSGSLEALRDGFLAVAVAIGLHGDRSSWRLHRCSTAPGSCMWPIERSSRTLPAFKLRLAP